MAGLPAALLCRVPCRSCQRSRRGRNPGGICDVRRRHVPSRQVRAVATVQLTSAAPAAPSSMPLAPSCSPTAALSTCRLQGAGGPRIACQSKGQHGKFNPKRCTQQTYEQALQDAPIMKRLPLLCQAFRVAHSTTTPSHVLPQAHLPASQSPAPALAAFPAPLASSPTALWLPGFGAGLPGQGMLPRCQQSPPTCTAGDLTGGGQEAVIRSGAGCSSSSTASQVSLPVVC